jgi:hypothetical protein
LKGKRLFQLIRELNKTEHRQLVNACKLSADKRSIALGELLRKRNLTETGFEKWLIALARSWNIAEPAELDKKQRRWIDFSCKEIETLLILNQFSDSRKRQRELAEIFDKRNHEELTGYYNHLAVQSALANKNLNALIAAYDIDLRWLGRNQTKTNIASIGSVLQKRKEATELSYHEAMSYFYSLSSALYIDNPDEITYRKIAPGKQQFVAMRSSAEDQYSKALYWLAETRFNFYDQTAFEQYLKAAGQAIQNCGLEERLKQQLTRNFLYLRITSGLYYGFDLKEMRKNAESMLRIMLQFKIYDPIGFFFLLFFLLLDNDFEAYDTLLKRHKTTFFNNENKDYPLFLESLMIYLKEGSEKALDNLQKTCYSKSLYIAAWSKLLEIEIHAARNDNHFVQVLIDRAKRFIKTNSGHRLIVEPVAHVLNAFDRKQSKKVRKNDHKLFAYYAMFLKT